MAPGPDIAVFVDLDSDHVGLAADRAILDVFLTGPRGGIDGNDDFLSTGFANVGGFVGHEDGPTTELNVDRPTGPDKARGRPAICYPPRYVYPLSPSS